VPEKNVERQFQGYALQLFDKVIAKHPEWPLRAHPIQEEERSDILIKDAGGRAFLLVELKDYRDPRFATPYAKEITDQALRYSETLGNRYYITWNMIDGILWDRMKPRAQSELGRVISVAPSVIESYRQNLSLTKQQEEHLLAQLEFALSTVINLEAGKKWEYSLDERFIARVESLINSHLGLISQAVLERYRASAEFRQALIRYVKDEQDWPWPSAMTSADLEDRITNLTKLSLLLLCTKAIFYHTLFTFRKGAGLPRLRTEGLNDPQALRDYLWRDYFKLVINRIDYEGLLGEHPTFIDDLPFVSEGAVQFVNHLVENINEFNFSEVPHDIVGKIFEKLIDEERRHQMGQYFTRSDVASLISVFTIMRGSELVMDAGSGSGTFSVQAYERMKAKLPGQDHWERLQRIWSCEIAPYPAHLTMLNMILRDLRYEKNYPRVINDDFFRINGHYQAKVKNPDGTDEYVNLPQFDAVIGNPPYTRQEEMKEVAEGLKTRAFATCSREWPGIKIPKNSSLFAYFMLHGGALLREGGRLGMITSNSWLDVDYGRAIQEMLLKNFKLIAIIDSKVERWFEAADVNTCITIAERCSDEAKRQSNPVRFVYLLVRLDELWKHYTVEKFANEIETLKEPGVHQNRFYKAFVIRQSELLAEATNSEGNFTGAKWGKYLRAPAVYFRILERAKDRLVPLGSVAKVRRGFTTGANDFFYLRDITDEIPEAERPKHTGLSEEERRKKGIRICLNGWGAEVLIEREFLRPVVKSPKDVKGIIVRKEDLPWMILMVPFREKYPLRGKEVLKYIERWGEERMKCNERPTCRARKPWFYIEEREPWPILFPMIHNQRQAVGINKASAQVDHNLFELRPKNKRDTNILAAFLSSTFSALYKEFLGRVNLGLGAIKTEGVDIVKFPVLNSKKLLKSCKERIRKSLERLSARPIKPICEEIEMPDRRELDLAVLEALGFEDELEREMILEELYSAVWDMVQSRLEKAKSFEEEEVDQESGSLGR
jgi:type I restriction-modification system DNA methylase subunit